MVHMPSLEIWEWGLKIMYVYADRLVRYACKTEYYIESTYSVISKSFYRCTMNAS